MIKISVPASTANLGPGFDALGLALDLYNTYLFEPLPEGVEIISPNPIYNNERNLVYITLKRVMKRLDNELNGIRIQMTNQIPISRGLGSSAACILAGVIAANELCGHKLTEQQVYEIAVELEGHSDNITSQYFGGMTTSLKTNHGLVYQKIPVAKGLTFCALVPNFNLETKKSRAVLPKTIPYQDGVFNVSHVSMLITSMMNGSFENLRYALQDKLHEPYRSKLIPDFYKICSEAKSHGALGAYLSGGGPTIMTLKKTDNVTYIPAMEQFLSTLKNKWIIHVLRMDEVGTRIEVLS